MNNTKWRKLFEAIEDSEIALPVCEWKFLRGERWFRWSTPKRRHLNQTGILDRPPFQPFPFKDIEQIRWPENYEVQRGPGLEPWQRTQELKRLEALIKSLGQFDYETDQESFTLFGYREP